MGTVTEAPTSADLMCAGMSSSPSAEWRYNVPLRSSGARRSRASDMSSLLNIGISIVCEEEKEEGRARREGRERGKGLPDITIPILIQRKSTTRMLDE